MTQAITMRIGLPDLVIPDAWTHVLSFFTQDPSSTHYDEYILSGQSPIHRVVAEDVVAINTSMRARSPHKDWQTLTAQTTDLPELLAVDPAWDIFETPPDVWEDMSVSARLYDLFAKLIRPGIGISRATKVLHIKRPRLIPVCDAYVLNLIGIPDKGAGSGVDLVEHFRAQGRNHYLTLKLLQSRLIDAEPSLSRTLLRILDVLVWGSHPDAKWTAPAGRPTSPAPG